MRMIGALSLLAVCGMLASVPARADTTPPFKGNDTGGIIAYSLVSQTDVKALAVDHCARYGKVVKFLGSQPYYGGYISFPVLGAVWTGAAAARLPEASIRCQTIHGASMMRHRSCFVSPGCCWALPPSRPPVEMPTRKAGLWEIKMQPAPLPEMTMQHCTDETTDSR